MYTLGNIRRSVKKRILRMLIALEFIRERISISPKQISSEVRIIYYYFRTVSFSSKGVSPCHRNDWRFRNELWANKINVRNKQTVRYNNIIVPLILYLTHYQLLIYYYYYIANVLQSDLGRCCNNYLWAYIAENLLLLFGCLERRAGRQKRIF